MSDEGASSQVLSAKSGKKRKRQAEESSHSKKDDHSKTTVTDNIPEGRRTKQRKRGKASDKGSPKKQHVEQHDQKDELIDESIGKMDGRLLVDYFAQRAKKLNKDLSAVELNDLSVPELAFFDTSSFSSKRSMDQLPAFLKSFSPNEGASLSKAAEEKGSPHTLVVTAAALRAADLVRALRVFQNKESIVGKLFAKHIKFDEAKQFLQRARVGIGVGTPQRLSDLIDSETLKLDKLERIVIDGSHIDEKQRGIFDMKETHFPLLQLLARSQMRERYGKKENPVKILVF